MTQDQFDQLLIELRAIKALLGRQATPAPAAASKPGDIPAPTEVIVDAANVVIHFGKNQGKALGDLGAKSVEWYAQEPEPRLKKDGTPFPPRAEDVRLRNAARTLVYERLGKLPCGPGPILGSVTMSEETPF